MIDSGRKRSITDQLIAGLILLAVGTVVTIIINRSGGSGTTPPQSSTAPVSDSTSASTSQPPVATTPAAASTSPSPATVAVTSVPPAPPPPQPQRVELATLCSAPGAESYICGADYKGDIQVGSQLFTYHGHTNAFEHAEPPNWSLLVTLPSTTCKSISLTFAIPATRSDAVANLRVVQEGAAAVSASTKGGTIGTLQANLSGGSFRLEGNSTTGDAVYAEGHAVCTTDSGA